MPFELGGDIALGASGSEKRYPLARDPRTNELLYEAIPLYNQEGVPDIPVAASWPHGFVGGLGETFRISEDSTGFMQSQNVDTTGVGVTRLRGKAVTSSAFTAGVGNVSTFFIEASKPALASTSTATTSTTITDSTQSWVDDEWIGHIVAVTGDPGGVATITDNNATVLTFSGGWSNPGDPDEAVAYGIVGSTGNILAFQKSFGLLATTSGSAITVNSTEKTFTGTAPATGKPAKFKGFWHIPLGGVNTDENIAKLVSPKANIYADDPTGGDQAGHLATRARGAVEVMNFSGETAGSNAHKVGITTDGTTYPAPGFEVGDINVPITNMAAGVSGTFVAKQNNLFRIINGISQPLTRFNEADTDEDHGAGLMVPGGSDSCFYNHGGLYFFDGHNVTNISPEVNPAFVRYGATLKPDTDFTFLEGAYGSDTWTYWIAKSGSDSYMMALRKDGDRFTWHPLFFLSGVNLRGCLVDSGNRVWTMDTTNKKFIHIALGASNQPMVAGDLTGESLSDIGQLVFPATDFGYPNVKKQFRSQEAFFWGVDAENTCRFGLSTDGGSFSNFEAAITSADGAFVQRKASSATSGYTFAGGMNWPLCDGTNDPRFRGPIMRASLLPEKAIRHTFVTDTSLNKDGRDGETILADIRTLHIAAPTKFEDPGGTSDDARVTKVHARVKDTEGTSINYLIEVEVVSWEI